MPDRWMACTERLCLRQLRPGDAVQLSEVAEPGNNVVRSRCTQKAPTQQGQSDDEDRSNEDEPQPHGEIPILDQQTGR
jgi:hypothetical protein